MRLVFGLLILALVSLAAAGIWAWVFFTRGEPVVIVITVPTGAPPTGFDVATEQQVFKDLLQVILTIAGVFLAIVAVFGVGAYALLSQQIERRVNRSTDRLLNLANAGSKLDVGFLYWQLYRLSGTGGQPQASYLDTAIEETNLAYQRHLVHLDEEERQVRWLICTARNNLAYYLWEKNQPGLPVPDGERTTMLAYADYIEGCIPEFPELGEGWADTISKVRHRLGNSPTDSAAAKT